MTEREGGAREIHVAGRIRSTSQLVESSVTGWKCAVVHYTLSYDRRDTDNEGRTTIRRVHVDSVDVSADLTLDTERGPILVPSGSYVFDVGDVAVSPLPSTGRLPPELEAETKGRTEAWLVGERMLQIGDPVELTGTVVPARDPSHAFEVVPQTGSRLRDRSLDDVAEDLALMGVDPKAKQRIVLIAVGVIFALAILALVVVFAGAG